MKHLNKLLEQFKDLTSGNERHKDAEEQANQAQHLLRKYMGERLEENDYDGICAVVKKIPVALFHLNHELDVDKDRKLAQKMLLSYFGYDREFINSFDRNSVFVNSVATVISPKWMEEHSSLFDEEMYEMISENLDFRILSIFIEHFVKNVEDKGAFAARLHRDSIYKEEFIRMPQEVVKPLEEFIDVRTFEAIKPIVMSGRAFYSYLDHGLRKREGYVCQEDLFDRFYTEDDLKLVLECHYNKHSKARILKRFYHLMNRDQVEAVVKDIVLESYPEAEQRGHHTSTYKSLSQDIVDKTADIAFKHSPWCYIYFNDENRLKFLNEVDFEKYKGLLCVHPKPTDVPVEKWKEVILSQDISSKAIPEHLLSGELALTNEEWFELIINTRHGKNKIFSGLAKHHNYVVTEALLDLLVDSSSQAANHPFVFAHKEKRKHERLVDRELAKAIEVAKTGNARKIAKSLTKIVANNVASKDVFEAVIEAVLSRK
ncbi:hypothetical protein [Vibrio crassostreae]|uniref:hypothetical protein n=1 Tax=Vibrio crassostreae TaxID=246167 RepID=UPI001B30F538|nr:hypothetical protein [Vibrio crassostreae]